MATAVEIAPKPNHPAMKSNTTPNKSDQTERLRAAIAHSLPPAYNFEVEKTITRLNQERARAVCLQFPEGLLVWGEAIAALLEEFTETVQRVVVLGDVTYGACCVDDIKAVHLGCDFLVHYAHSCLVPIDAVNIKCLYVFVEIYLNPRRLARTIKDIILLATIQFSKCVHQACRELVEEFGSGVFIPQCEPLTAGETLGCTSPVFPAGCRTCVFVADGRFHVESAMIQNPETRFYRYDPFTRRLVLEEYDHSLLFRLRNGVLRRVERAHTFVLILSSLGRQGSVGLVEHARVQVRKYRPTATVLTVMLAELVPSTLGALLQNFDDPGRVCFVNVGCPRLALDWGHEFTQAPFITTYEMQQVLATSVYAINTHPMDYFSAKGGDWSNYGRDGNRNGSIGHTSDKAAMRERLRQKWLQRKQQIAQNCRSQNLQPGNQPG
ncbi:diphthamide biosynthesis protein 1 [Gregarina niphandrodes]|uniref:2-(3-amino-3-carboxypropyl)histidine synthase subunit 1 n=1 Tax=Gregarina niphandrodes TaxID=110365 RepID=A0A023AZF0_GRENI|nr:diphthamide biosynthesis protein 1 [Gregarina niphandrodes]EZG43853.1 diphthamide biosynthesis protein 1 [Gregarina niphandrodes]|eukprot:XP_011132974.1 diphthamide biosynthesis protein 1 [Gregarina niphandrodes]